MEHLIESLHALAQADVPERIRHIQSNLWIRYPAADFILNRLEELLAHPRVGRMPNMMLIGETNNGKSKLIDRFCKMHKSPSIEGDEKVVRPVIAVDAPSKPDERKFYRKLLTRLNSPFRQSDRVDRMEHQVFHILGQLNTRMLIIDEIQDLMVGSSTSQRMFLNVIKGIANELQIVIVAAGTMEARNAMSSSPQMSNRFKQKFLPKWQYDEDYLRLLASFERLMPLRKPSILTDAVLAERIYTMSEGLIGEISSVITTAAVAAIHSGKERIDRKLLDQIDFQLPSERRRGVIPTS
jgi:type II secretory pathway predicted ATPase ExeA